MSVSHPPFVKAVEPPGLLKRAVAKVVLGAIDAGWTRRTPLRTHVVMCGFPRAGSTLLALMMQASYRQAKGFPRERPGVRVAYVLDRNHSLLVSKRPDDIFYVDDIRRIYRGRAASVKFVLTMRDPRAILTSMHSGRKGDYYVSPERWRSTYEQFTANAASPDCLMVRFEDLIASPPSVQSAIERFIGEPAMAPFEEYMDNVPVGFREAALNGLRPPDPTAVDKWRSPRHADRIRAMLRALPELPSVLVHTGYESDQAWTEAYRDGS